MAVLLSACATTSPQSPCHAGEQLAVVDSLYFGSGEVKPEQWQEFLAAVITPRFPEGLTSWPAAGQWRNDAGVIEKESSYVLQLVHADTPQAENGIQEVVSLYKNQFHQRAVLRVRSRVCVSFVATVASAFAADAPPLRLSHAWIVVTTGAPERKALEKAGFRIAPTVNRHEGQGTASVTIEFLNGFLELIYPDPTVAVSPALKAGAEKFRLKSAWRETGYSPIGIVFDRTPATPEKLPFATWKISADWMEKGTFIEMMSPREMPKVISLSISSHTASTRESENEALARDPVKGAMFLHPNGARRLTGMRVVAPNADSLPPAASYIAGHGLVEFEVGSQWLLDVTLDDGKQGITKDLEPDLPMVIHY